MALAGERSKFSCLKIYDDTSSSDEGTTLMAKTLPGKSKNRGNQKTTSGKKSSGGLIVHQVPQKPKNKGKKNKKTPVVVEDGFIVQDGDEDYLEKRYREDLQQAIENSRDMASTASAMSTQKTKSKPDNVAIGQETESGKPKDAIEMLIHDVDAQASVLFTNSEGAQKAREQQLVSLYRSKLLETLGQMTLEREVKLKAEAEATKYKNRYKKLCELLKDAEVNEKAHMAADLEKAMSVEKELSSQIGELQGELMQARSKIRELEVKNKELASKH